MKEFFYIKSKYINKSFGVQFFLTCLFQYIVVFPELIYLIENFELISSFKIFFIGFIIYFLIYFCKNRFFNFNYQKVNYKKYNKDYVKLF